MCVREKYSMAVFARDAVMRMVGCAGEGRRRRVVDVRKDMSSYINAKSASSSCTVQYGR